ncbi:hypothetical protein CWIS_04480 [Cellulomonas sp. A375-1]|uniref:HIRAN domain-containing protein n=1 Tax=Cellulomonas sp. A375-1 TaxID=1672219 RepID=UPI000652695E|nr:HIRAN domain-containing protein [Cellulomonas sp. A375-1]KMM46561.1 hypothetical protein CWIS_04480 [Cellulomonas sp. A375-1]
MSVIAVHDRRPAPADRARGAASELVVAWQHPVARQIYPVGMLRFDGVEYTFHYIRAVQDASGFRPLLGFGDLTHTYRSDRLFPLFSQRALDPRRPDYVRHVASLGLDPADATPWEQITRSSGRRNGDTLQLFPVPRSVGGRITCSFLVHGIRHMPENRPVIGGSPSAISAERLESVLCELQPGSPLRLAPEPTNTRNPEAILVLASGQPIGYVPDLLVRDVHRLAAVERIDVSVIRVNGPDAPAHLRVLAQLDSVASDGFEFFRGERWEPLD